jgi:AraC-like DNA-binding protein
MATPESILLIFCALGIAQSIFFACCLLSFKDGDKASNRIFSALLIAVAIRLAKSVTYYFFVLDPVFMNIGYAAHLAIGPLLYLYVTCYSSRSHKFSRINFLHFVPAFIVLTLSFYLNENFWLPWGYAIALYYSLAYLAFTWFFLYSSRLQVDIIERSWLAILLCTMSVLGIAYFSNFILGVTSYITGPLLYSLMIYFMSYVGFKFYNEIFGMKMPLRKLVAISEADARHYIVKLDQILNESRPYLDPALNLARLAKLAGMQPYRLSHLINDHYQMSFTDFINTRRIEAAKAMLTDPHGSRKKVATIAYEVGFNTLSAFNNSFKRQTSQTPKEYRKANNTTP